MSISQKPFRLVARILNNITEVGVAITQLDPSVHTTIGVFPSAEGCQDFRTFFLLSFVGITQHESVDNCQENYGERAAKPVDQKISWASSDESILTHKIRFMIVVFRNLGPSFEG